LTSHRVTARCCSAGRGDTSSDAWILDTRDGETPKRMATVFSMSHMGSLLDFALHHGPPLLRCEGRHLQRRLDF